MKNLTLTREDGSTFEVVVHQLKVAQYQQAFSAWTSENEARQISIGVQRATDPQIGEQALTQDWPMTLKPESYEALCAAWQELNQPFFAWCGRLLGNRSLRMQAANLVSAGLSSSPTSGSRLV